MEQVGCNLCGSEEYRLLYPSTLDDTRLSLDSSHFRCTASSYGQHLPIVKCSSCGLVYANPRPRAEEVLNSYVNVVDRTYVEERQGRELTFRRNLRPLEKLMPPGSGGRVLDVGCYIGIFLEVAEASGWEAWGVEPCRWAAEEARTQGLRVFGGTLREADYPESFFDAATMWDVIEHLTDPAQELKEVHRVLRPGGILCIHTINIDSLLARLMGPRWPWLMEMHLYYFTPRTLSLMLHQSGFQPIKKASQGRFLRLGFLMRHLSTVSPSLTQGLERLVSLLRLAEVPVPVNTGDLFTMYARRT